MQIIKHKYIIKTVSGPSKASIRKTEQNRFFRIKLLHRTFGKYNQQFECRGLGILRRVHNFVELSYFLMKATGIFPHGGLEHSLNLSLISFEIPCKGNKYFLPILPGVKRDAKRIWGNSGSDEQHT